MSRLLDRFAAPLGLLLGSAAGGAVYALAQFIAHTWPEFHP